MKILKKHLKKPWPYWLGGIVLGIMNVILLGLTGFSWKVTGGFLAFNQSTISNIGIVLGSLLATLLASEFKFKKIKNKKQFFTALIGGIMMGYGARIASGCNIGAFFSGVSSFSLHGWVFGIFMILGTGIGMKFLTRFIL